MGFCGKIPTSNHIYHCVKLITCAINKTFSTQNWGEEEKEKNKTTTTITTTTTQHTVVHEQETIICATDKTICVKCSSLT
jgi:hypothetical protein